MYRPRCIPSGIVHHHSRYQSVLFECCNWRDIRLSAADYILRGGDDSFRYAIISPGVYACGAVHVYVSVWVCLYV